MKRHLLNSLTILSLLVCTAVAALWTRSFFVSDRIVRCPLAVGQDGFRFSEQTLTTWPGVLTVGYMRHDVSRSQPASGYDMRLQEARSHHLDAPGWTWKRQLPQAFPVTADQPLSRFGFFGWVADEQGAGHRSAGVGWSMPFWSLVLPCSIPLLARGVTIVRRRRARRRGASRCPCCGYDLRATPDRCPECGTRGSVSGTG